VAGQRARRGRVRDLADRPGRAMPEREPCATCLWRGGHTRLRAAGDPRRAGARSRRSPARARVRWRPLATRCAPDRSQRHWRRPQRGHGAAGAGAGTWRGSDSGQRRKSALPRVDIHRDRNVCRVLLPRGRGRSAARVQTGPAAGRPARRVHNREGAPRNTRGARADREPRSLLQRHRARRPRQACATARRNRAEPGRGPAHDGSEVTSAVSHLRLGTRLGELDVPGSGPEVSRSPC